MYKTHKKDLIHPWERPMRVVNVIIFILATCASLGLMAYSRVREYTCDRHGVWLAPEGKEGLTLLAAGKHIYKYVDIDAYLATSKITRVSSYGFTT